MNGKRFNSYFVEIFNNMMLTLVVPFIVIILLCFQTEATIKDQIVRFNEKIINNTLQGMDIILERILEKEMKISLSQECINYANYMVYYPKKTALQSLEVKDVLSFYGINECSDWFVYYPYKDKIISDKKGTSNAENYYATYYAASTEGSREDFFEILSCNSKRPTFYVMNRDGEDTFLCIAMRKVNKNRNLDYVVAAVLDPDCLRKLMYTDDADKNGTLLIFDSNQELLACGGNKDVAYYMKDYDSIGSLYEIELEDGTAMMQIQKSASTNIYYAYATKSEYFWQEIAKIRMTAVIYILICVAASVFWAFLRTKRTYQPMNSIMQYMQEQYKNKFNREVNEFEYIEKLLNEKSMENDALSRKVRESTSMKRDSFITSIVAQDPFEGKDGNKGFAENDIRLCSDRFRVVVLKTLGGTKRRI